MLNQIEMLIASLRLSWNFIVEQSEAISNYDKIQPRQNVTQEVDAITFDLEQSLPTPVLTTNNYSIL